MDCQAIDDDEADAYANEVSGARDELVTEGKMAGVASSHLRSLASNRAPLSDIQDEALSGLRRLKEGNSDGTTELRKAEDLYRRAQARTAQAEKDIQALVDAAQALLDQGQQARVAANRTLDRAVQLRSALRSSQSCINDATTALHRRGAWMNDTYADHMQTVTKKEANLADFQTKLQAVQEAVARNLSRAETKAAQAARDLGRAEELSSKAVAKSDAASDLAKRAQAREALANTTLRRGRELQTQAQADIANAKSKKELLDFREQSLEKAKALVKDREAKATALSANASALTLQAKVKLQHAEEVLRNGTAVQQQANEALGRAGDAMLDAQNIEQRGRAALKRSEAELSNATAQRELATQQMRDTLMVLKGVDPGGRRTLERAFEAQRRAEYLRRQECLLNGTRGPLLQTESKAATTGMPLEDYSMSSPPSSWLWVAGTATFLVFVLLWAACYTTRLPDGSSEPFVGLKAGHLSCFCFMNPRQKGRGGQEYHPVGTESDAESGPGPGPLRQLVTAA